jgi:hypothetical protein
VEAIYSHTNAKLVRNSTDFFTSVEEARKLDPSNYNLISVLLVRSDIADLATESENTFRPGTLETKLDILRRILLSGKVGLLDLLDNEAFLELTHLNEHRLYFRPCMISISRIDGNGYFWLFIYLVTKEQICIAPICAAILYGWSPVHPIKNSTHVIYLNSGRLHRSVLFISVNGICRVTRLWDDYYEQLVEYFSVHGHSNIPYRDQANPDLARW